jgi:L-arabinose isomerase
MQTEKVKSFEISTDEAVGDIVSRDRKVNKAKLKVGLLPLAWFEWWPMFEESDMEAKIKGDAQLFVKKMIDAYGDQYEFVTPAEVVDTLDKAYDAGEKFKNAGIEALIIDEATYLTDFIPIEVINHLPPMPIIIFATQATSDLWGDMKNTDVIRFEGLVGNAQIAGAFRKMGRDYRVVTGPLDSLESFAEIEKHLRVIDLIKSLKSMDIGLLGHTFRGMYDIEVDKTKIKGVFGPNVLYLDVSHLINIWNTITQDEIQEYIQELERELPFPMVEVTEADRHESVRLGLAVRKLIKKFNIDTLTLLGQHHVEVSTRASADFSFYCAEKDGCMTTHEGDLANLITKYILNKLSGKLPVFLEWTAFDKKTDSMLLTHHGVVDPREHAADLQKCRFTPSPEKWDFFGKGFSVEYTAKPGLVTLASIINEQNSWKLLISRGECIEREPAPCFAPQFFFKHESYEVTEYITKILQEGVAHHTCLVYGDYVDLLKLYAGYISLPVVMI